MIMIANAKKAELLQILKSYINTLSLRLYKNDYLPTSSMTADSFTEVTDTGYVRRPPGGFGNAAFNNVTNHAEIKADEWITVFDLDDGGFTVYGYYVVDPADGKPVWAERANTPFVVANVADCYAVVPKLSLSVL